MSTTPLDPADEGLWVTPGELKAWWTDCPPADQARELLWAAQDQCIAYAPALDDADPPARYKRALRLQARELWQAGTRDTAADTVGMDGYAVRIRPLSAVVRQLLRPPSALGPIG